MATETHDKWRSGYTSGSQLVAVLHHHPQGTLEMTGDVFACHFEKKMLQESSGQRPGMLLAISYSAEGSPHHRIIWPQRSAVPRWRDTGHHDLDKVNHVLFVCSLLKLIFSFSRFFKKILFIYFRLCWAGFCLVVASSGDSPVTEQGLQFSRASLVVIHGL